MLQLHRGLSIFPRGRLLSAYRSFGSSSPARSSSSSSSSGENGADIREPDLEALLTDESRARQPSPIRALMPLLATPGMISLGGGLPHPETFPFGRISVRLEDGTKMRIDDEEVATALQYSPTNGLPQLVRRLKDIVRSEHNPPREARPGRPLALDGWDLMVTNGSQDGLTRAMEMLVPAGGSLLLESPTYSGALAFLQPRGCHLEGVATDEGGLLPEALAATLDGWGAPGSATEGVARPRVLYTIPTGANPTGGSLSLERKRAIYEIARRPENDLLVLEDDPYYYLQFNTPRVPSFLSMDVDGRVIRFDSFSKVLSAGCRLGFATAAPALLERMSLHVQSTALHTSGLSQLLVQKLLERWEDNAPGGYKSVEPARGFETHVQKVSSFYRERRDHFLACAERHLTGVATWNVPSAGMFVWIKLHGVTDTSELIQQRAVDAKVLFVPGKVFMPNGEDSPYVRAAYSTATFDDIDEALKRLRGLMDQEVSGH